MRTGKWVLLAALAVLAAPANARQDGVDVQQRKDVEVQSPTHPGAMTKDEMDRLIGTDALSSQGREVGEVENVLVDPSGRIRAVVLEWGGVLGLGARHAVVPATDVRFEADRAVVDLTREQLERLPRYDPDVPSIAGVDPDLKPVR
jgi:sporulation protein YlmC with PRC-barrel domain